MSIVQIQLRSLLVLAAASLLVISCGGASTSVSSVAPLPRDTWPTRDWNVTSPQDQNMDADLLSQADRYIVKHTPDVRALLVVRHGAIVFEKYYQGYTAKSYHGVMSVTKSVTSALIGIALQQQYLSSLDQKLETFFPEYLASDRDAQKRAITIGQLLSMTGGFDWDEASRRERFHGWFSSGNQIKTVLGTPLAHKPGQVFTYNSASAHLLSAIITKATHMSALDFAKKNLFGPLGIATDERGFAWETDRQGYSKGGYGLHLTARDMAKFGYLYLHQGRWEEKQIIPAEYVSASTRRQSAGGPPEGTKYGYLWWVTTNHGYAAYFAAGFGGQFIYVVPDLDIVVVIVSNTADAGIDHKDVIDLFVIPAVKS